jgi:endonuclease/exonuclease/phosphatase (EEP) superfamily protein YafD
VAARRIEWAVAGTLAGWAAARLTGADRLRLAESWSVPLLSFTPQAATGAWASALLLRGKGPAAVAAMAGAAMTAAVTPRATGFRQPAATGPVVRLLTANLFVGRGSGAALTELSACKHADVVFVQELTDEAVEKLRRAGMNDLFPHTVRPATEPGRLGSAIFARFPLLADSPGAGPVAGRHSAPVCAAPVSAARCTARLAIPSGPFVRLACIHAQPPKPPWSPSATARWRSQLSALPPLGADPVILAGDFNATLDHLALRRLLHLGYVDAASQVGNGLASTWGPRPHRRPALLAIDHFLVSQQCAVLATSTHVLPGSDHRAVYAEIRLPAAGAWLLAAEQT